MLAATCGDYKPGWGDLGKIRISDDYDRLYLLERGEAFVRDDHGMTI